MIQLDAKGANVWLRSAKIFASPICRSGVSSSLSVNSYRAARAIEATVPTRLAPGTGTMQSSI